MIAAFALGLVVAVGAGCQGTSNGVDTTPSTTESSTSPSPSSSPTPSKPPQMPAKAKADDYAGAVAFIRHYYELAEYGEETGDWKPLREATSPQCNYCKKFWQPDPPRQVNYRKVHTDPPSINDLVNGIAQVNVSMTDQNRTKHGGEMELSWTDTVQCTFDNGQWQVISIEPTKF